MSTNTYRIFLKKTDKGVIEDLELVEERTNIWCIFSFGYLVYKKLYLPGAILGALFCIFVAIFGLFACITLPLLSIYVALKYADWRSIFLLKHGYEFLDYSSGKDKKEAKLNFLENFDKNHEEQSDMQKKIY